MKDLINKLVEVVGKKKIIAIIGGLIIMVAGSFLGMTSDGLCELVCSKCSVPTVEIPSEVNAEL